MDASSTRGTQPVDVVARASSPVHPPPADEHGTLDCGGARIAYAVWRDTRAPTVVLVHGGRAHSAWWHPVIATGCLGDVRIVTLDLSGHGDSDRRDTYRPELWAAEVASVVATGSGKAVLVGHSMGGLVSVVAAARHPALVDGLVLVDTMFRRPDPIDPARPRGAPGRPLRPYSSRAEAAAAFRLLPTQPVVNPGAVAYVAEHSAGESGGAWRWKFDPAIARQFNDASLQKYLGRVRCPLEMIFGAQSALVSTDTVIEVEAMTQRAIPFCAIDDGHHHVLLDRPVETAEAIAAAIGRMCPTESPRGG